MKITFLSHTAMGGSFVVGSHHLALAFARANHDVIHLSAPISVLHLALVAREPFIRVRLQRWLLGGEDFQGIKDVVPLALFPWAVARLTPALMNRYSRSMLTAPMRGLGELNLNSSDCIFLDEPRFVGLAAERTGRTLVYRATDLYSLMRRDPKIIDAERTICARADVLVATSEPVAAHLRQISGRGVHVVPNGVDFEHFALGKSKPGGLSISLPGRREDRAIYVGAYDDRFGIDAFRSAVLALPHKQFILAGPRGAEVAAGLAKPNVTALGHVNYAALPQLLHQCAVGLLPMSTAASNVGRSPMKFYEYAAAGLTIASTSSDEIERRELATLCLADGDSGFPTAVARAFERSADPALVDAARGSARREDWQRKASILLGLANGVDVPKPSSVDRLGVAAVRE